MSQDETCRTLHGAPPKVQLRRIPDRTVRPVPVWLGDTVNYAESRFFLWDSAKIFLSIILSIPPLKIQTEANDIERGLRG